MKILFTGGGTGGHVMPILSIARALKKIAPERHRELHYLGPKEKISSQLLMQEGFEMHSILPGKLRRYFSLMNIVDVLFTIPISFIQSFFQLTAIKPNLIFSKGGTGSLPVTYCARMLRIPVFIHESDISPGLSNRITSKWAQKIFTSFEKTEYFPAYKVQVVGNPIRTELLGGNKEEAVKLFQLSGQRPVILIMGGSQGSQSINDFILLILNDVLQKHEIIHIAGSNKYKKAFITSKGFLPENLKQYYHLYEFLNQEQLRSAYAVCDIIVSRAGSGSIFEIAALGKPSILIPLPTAANNHQTKNAYAYHRTGAALILEQENLSPAFFLGEVQNIVFESKKMAEAALRFSKPDAAEKIAQEIINDLRF